MTWLARGGAPAAWPPRGDLDRLLAEAERRAAPRARPASPGGREAPVGLEQPASAAPRPTPQNGPPPWGRRPGGVGRGLVGRIGWPGGERTLADLVRAMALARERLRAQGIDPDAGPVARALLVMQGSRDRLFPPDGMRRALDRLGAAYAKAGHGERFRGRMIDVPHQFNLEMQEEAFQWLDRWV